MERQRSTRRPPGARLSSSIAWVKCSSSGLRRVRASRSGRRRRSAPCTDGTGSPHNAWPGRRRPPATSRRRARRPRAAPVRCRPRCNGDGLALHVQETGSHAGAPHPQRHLRDTGALRDLPDRHPLHDHPPYTRCSDCPLASVRVDQDHPPRHRPPGGSHVCDRKHPLMVSLRGQALRRETAESLVTRACGRFRGVVPKLLAALTTRRRGGSATPPVARTRRG